MQRLRLLISKGTRMVSQKRIARTEENSLGFSNIVPPPTRKTRMIPI